MALEDDILLLQQLDFFSAFEPDQLRLMLFAAERRVLKVGETLFTKGSPSSCGFIVQSGMIALMSELDAPAQTFLGPGSLIGELALIIPSERPMHAVARKVTIVIGLPRSLMHRLLSEYPESALRLRERLSARFVNFNDRLSRIGSVLDAIE